jgi:hypothetical protein
MMIRSEYGKRYESLEGNVMGKRKNGDSFLRGVSYQSKYEACTNKYQWRYVSQAYTCHCLTPLTMLA